ncbi:hypothetical protein I4U23_025945 [Adineta vaga]|nr:hypothetical protein I4U23_025945 [Adineta vaga]
MDWVAAKSYYISYKSLDRFLSITFIHNYLLTWSIALLCSLILPLLYLFAPGSLRTTRSTHFLLVCIVGLSYMSSLFIQAYMITNAGEPNLPYHGCRFVVYISTFAKPIGLYLTLLFSLERLFTKIFTKIYCRTKTNHQLFQRLYALLIFITLILIFFKRLYDIFKILPRKQLSNIEQAEDIDFDSRDDITDINANSTDRNITFPYCFNSMNIDTYAKIVSFYIIQYWFEYVALGLLIVLLVIILVQQGCLSRFRPGNSVRGFSVNTKLYLSLSSCVISSEIVLLFFHLIVSDMNNDNLDSQSIALKLMLFTINFRCILLPIVICGMACDPLKQFMYELFFSRPYLENIEENDTINDRSEPFSSSQRTNTRLRDKFRRPFKNNSNNNNNNINHDDSEADL